MEKIYLSDSGPKVSPAIYGFYRWNTDEINLQKMESIVDLCLELGINTFDHLTLWGIPMQEMFGDIIKARVKRENCFVYKCGVSLPDPPAVRIFA
jgi:predicted oxidoreductase